METQKSLIKPIAFTYGLYLALLSILIMVVMYAANLDKSWTISIISTLLTIIIFVMGIKAYKSSNDNYLTLGEAIKVGLAIAVVGGVITAIYSYIHYEYIYPEFIEMTKENAYDQMIQQNPNMTEEQIDKAMSISNLFMSSTFFSFSAILGNLIFGLIISLITGAIIKKERP